MHLLRDLHTLKDQHEEDGAVVQWATEVRQVYDEAQDWLGEHPQATAGERKAAYTQAFTRACALGQQYAQTRDHPCPTLAKRLLRHQDELFQFLLVPGLPADNNLVERSLRPLVIMRKISGGSRSEEGTITRLTLASLLQTWAARNLDRFTNAWSRYSDPPPTPRPELLYHNSEQLQSPGGLPSGPLWGTIQG